MPTSDEAGRVAALDAAARRLSGCFSDGYAQARDGFIASATAAGAAMQSHALPLLGAEGEALAMDVARLGPAAPAPLLIVSSATHGVEGHCGSACQRALLQDRTLLAQVQASGIALLLVHGVNPHGYSHGRRVNEDNVDLNRNALPDAGPPPRGADDCMLDRLLLPDAWPPSAEDAAALASEVARRGEAAFGAAAMAGQYERPDGLYYGGTGPSWSVRTLHRVLAEHGRGARCIGWIDVHSGLGPWGHAGKIYAGRLDDGDLARARLWWGSDVAVPGEAESVTAPVAGPVAGLLAQACPKVPAAVIGLEFGTVPLLAMLDALRFDHWVHRHAARATPAQREAARRVLRAAFCPNDELWRGMVLGQFRTALLQAVLGLGAER